MDKRTKCSKIVSFAWILAQRLLFQLLHAVCVCVCVNLTEKFLEPIPEN